MGNVRAAASDSKVIIHESLNLNLRGEVILVTGGSGGLGRAIVHELGQLGAAVSIGFREHQEVAERAAEEIRRTSGSAIACRVDVRNLDEVRAMMERTAQELGEITGVVNNAGILRDKALMLMEEADWREVIDTNLTGVFNVCRACIVPMMKRKRGRIVNVSSTAGIRGNAGQTNYSASKAGMIGLTQALAKEVAGYGVTVNCVAPGFIAVGMVDQMTSERKDKAKREVPLGRFGEPKEVARFIAFLLGDGGSYITGQTFAIDGGLLL